MANMDKTEQKIFKIIAGDIGAAASQVQAAVRLLDDGATVPFIARYRKEVTGSLNDTQLRQLEERLAYLRELEDRRRVILESVRDQGKLTAELEAELLDADSKQRLEDLYLPYRPKRRTRAAIAREAGLEPLAKALLTIRRWIRKRWPPGMSVPTGAWPTSRRRSTAPATFWPKS